MGIRKLRNDIGKKVKSLRLEKGLSQENLAEYVNMSREHISCIERGNNLASTETLYALAKFFEIDIKDFFLVIMQVIRLRRFCKLGDLVSCGTLE